MSIENIASLEGYQKELQRKIEEEREGKVQLSNMSYYKLQILRFLIVGGNGAFNALYGWSLGYNLLSCFLLAIVMFSGDWALSILHQINSCNERTYQGTTLATKSGLALLSLVAGTSFMLGIKHAQDIKDSRITELQAELVLNQKKFNELGLTRTASRIRIIQSELETERQRVGNFSPANALPQYLSRLSGYPYEGIALVLNILWIAVLLGTGISLSAQLGMVWCPAKENQIAKELTQSLRTRAAIEHSHAAAIKEREQIKTRLETNPQNDSTNLRRKRPLYEEVRAQVLAGQVIPKQRALTELGMGAKNASEYLHRMTSEGVLQRKNRRGDYEVISH